VAFAAAAFAAVFEISEFRIAFQTFIKVASHDADNVIDLPLCLRKLRRALRDGSAAGNRAKAIRGRS
jgi:hypothetical protein